MTTVYVDGSCLNNGLPNASAGVGIYFGPGDPRNFSGKVYGNLQSSSRAELDAVRRALAVTVSNKDSYPVVSPVTIKTDSQYAIDSLTNPDVGKATNVPNLDIINDFRRQYQGCGFTVYLAHVSGHADNPGNNAAHNLAIQGARS
ncbi:hypothetical protein LPJ64_003343 [Coemansia asiatica]|uniref:RNase H type-1 domain-containing protein n=1 Tax=Coemansia asiatica TaxID=1052880 RepID=A0A9W7XI24_9FUNG|nr:hypothetical protein LPJ64_003343 [Coemansia asiatica]KAJ2883498.1 hypothetical protein FB639_002161 [Coemansia asiatica]